MKIFSVMITSLERALMIKIGQVKKIRLNPKGSGVELAIALGEKIAWGNKDVESGQLLSR